ncbi:MAG: hypothetical protein ASARMPREDX12_005167 [Alectoria sarmentosa]|nr:MAG: hypothetical protein ASARMPREDX12_005167 [Alectoria sarmentosa]
MVVLTPRSGGGDNDVDFKMGAGVFKYSLEADVEEVGFVEGVSGPLVAASTSVLCDGSCAFIVGVIEGRVDDGSILEEWLDVVSTLVLCEGSVALVDRVVEDKLDDDLEDCIDAVSTSVLCESRSALNECVVEDRLDDDFMLENLGDVALVDVDVVSAPDKIDEGDVDDDSLLEDTEASVTVDIILELFAAAEDRIDDVSTIEEAIVVADVVSILDGILEGRIDDDMLFEDMGDVVRVDNNVVLEPFEVGEDVSDDDSVLKDIEDVARVDDNVVPEPSEVSGDNIDETPTFEDVDNATIVDIDVLSGLDEVDERSVDDDPALEAVRDVVNVGIVVVVIPRLDRVLELPGLLVVVCVSTAGTVLVGREDTEDESALEVGLSPKIAPNIENMNDESFGGRVNVGLALGGVGDAVAINVVSRPDRVLEMSLPPVEDELVCGDDLEG